MAKNKNKNPWTSWIPTVLTVVAVYFGRSIFTQRQFITICVLGTIVCVIGFFATSKMLLKDKCSKSVLVFNKIIISLGLGCLLGSVMTGFVYTFINRPWFPFWGISLVIGLSLGILFTVKNIRKTKRKGIEILVGIVFSAVFMFLASMYISHLNYILDVSDPVTVKTVIVGKDVQRHRKGPDEYMFCVEIHGESFDIKVSYDEYESFQKGDVYSFEKYNGAFGEPFYISK